MSTKYCNTPAGLWETSKIIGSICKIRSIPVGYDFTYSNTGTYDSDSEHTIEEVYHRVDTEGHVFVSYKLEDIPERLFRPDEIFIIKVKISE